MSIYEQSMKVAQSVMQMFDEPDFEDGAWCNQEDLQKLERLSGAEMVLQGETKLIFYFSENPDYVFKVPVYSFERPLVASFLALEDSDFSYDYCGIETELYKTACKKNFQKFFVPIKFVGIFDYVPVYLSPFLPIVLSEQSKYLKMEIQKNHLDNIDFLLKEINENYDTCELCLSDLALTLFIQQYGFEETLELMDFLSEVGINDLHNGNLGLTEDASKLLILDYAGC